MTSEINESIKPNRKHLLFSAFAANLLYVSMGCSIAWPSAAIPLLTERGMKYNEITWMVSVQMIGSCLGTSVFNISIDRLGRKYSLLLTGIIFLLAWIILGLATEPYALYIGRFINGLGVGSTFNCIPVYLSEISDVKIRQTLTSCTEIFICFGCLIEYAAGPWLTYGYLALVSVTPCLVFGLAAMRIPESPYYLIAQGKKQEAYNTLLLLRGAHVNIEEELIQIEKSVKESKSQAGRGIDLFLKKGPRKALLLSALMFFILNFSASSVIISYLSPILAETSLPLSSKMATLIVGVMMQVFGFGEPFLVHRIGSKWTLVAGYLFTALFLLSFGIFKYFDERHYNTTPYTAIPLLCIILYELSFELGIGALPWAISVELFPPSLKGFGMNLVTTMKWIVDFTLLQIYGYVSPHVGISSCFIFYSAVLVIGTILIAILVPNTKDRALHSIHHQLDKS